MQRANSAGAGRTRGLPALVALVAGTWVALAPMPAAAAPGDPGTVSGRVIDSDGDPIAGICVNVDPGGQGATSQTDGSFEISGVDPGTYIVRFADCNATPTFISRWNLNQDQQSAADPVIVEPDAGVVLADNTLLRGVAVSGTVIDNDGGAPLEGINVFVNTFDGPGPSAGAVTAPDGTYRTGPLPDGTYRVQIDDPDDVYTTEFWDDHFVFGAADRLQLSTASGSERTSIDAALARAASITGTVSDESGVLGDICVGVNTPAGNGWNELSSARTTADGTYTIAGLPPDLDLRIQFRDCALTPSHVEQWYDGAPDFGSSTSVRLGPGEARAGIDARLTTGIRVAGTVTDEAGNALANIDVNVNPDGSGQGGYGRTDRDGEYITSPVLPGRFRVQFNDGSGTWASEYWDDQPTFGSATILELTGDDVPLRSGIDAQLAAAASISGTVTNPDGLPVPRACISVVTETPNGPDGVGGAQADDNGDYVVSGLPAVAVKVRAEDCAGVGPYLSRWWPDASSYTTATPIQLTAGDPPIDVDIELPLAGVISGRVTNAGGQPIADICVQATTSDAFGALTRTDGDGMYQLALEGGDYTIQFVDCRQQPAYAGLTVGAVAVVPGATMPNVNAVLVPGATATVSGSVRNGAGVAVTGACVVAYLANQYAVFAPVLDDGTFTLTGVPSGTFAIAFLGCGSGGEPEAVVVDPVDPNRTYRAQWWQGVDLSLVGSGDGGPDPIAQGATLVAVPPGGALTGFDQCFGCLPPTTTTTTSTTTTTTTTAPTSTTTPAQVVVTITGHTRRAGSIALSFTATDVVAATNGLVLAQLAEALTYTATCTSATAATATATVSGPVSPITVSGVNDRATYTCVISASANGVVLATSAPVPIGPRSTGTLPATGSNDVTTTWAAALITLAGAAIVLAARRPRKRQGPARTTAH